MLVKDLPDSQDVSFHTQGPIPPDTPLIYIRRRTDDVLERLINSRDYVALIGPRLCGKSSMLLHQWARLRESPVYVPVYIALGQLATLDEAAWIGRIHTQIARQTDGLLPMPADPAPHALALEETIAEALEQELQGKVLVVMLDQIETTPPAHRTSFFAALREMFVNRALRPVWHNVVCVLAGRFIPDELIADPAISPFRVAEVVYVEDADLEGSTQLVACLGYGRRQIASDVPARVYEWTEGDVYLTHKLCAGLARDIPDGAVTFSDVDRAARRHLHEDALFRQMWAEIQADPDIAGLINTLLEHRERVRFTLLQRHIMMAWLEGAIKADANGYCVMHSLVHESVFFALRRKQSGLPKLRRTSAMSMAHEMTILRNRYRLEHVLHPGMASYIYRATDLDTGEHVAVKQLMVSRELNEMAWLRFQRESDALRHLDHPHIIRLIDAFREDDFEYIVMEYVYGGSLFDRLNREGRFPLRQALEIAGKLAGALAHVHSRHIVHGDVKPSNTLLTHDYSPRLSDFGMARLNYHQRVTLPHAVVGTTPYLSPEGVLGETIDERGDIWSLGVMLYEMLAGTLPFTGRTDEAIARAILDEDAPDVRAIRPDVPESVVAVLQKMLTRSLTHRTQTAEEVCDALHDALQAISP